ncbi:MAG: sodium/proline symporter [Chloroflexi bacterium]|nr:sodium/proline symporter [Chloroflexota bacterium]
MSSAWVIAVFSAYFFILILIAVDGARRMKNMSEYVLGGRRLSSITAALSAGSSTTSAWTMLVLPALAYVGGLVELWIPIALVVGLWLSWTLIAKRLRRYTIAAGDALTIPEFFEVRFGDTTGMLRALTAAITILFVVFYVSSGLLGGAKLLDTMFGIETTAGILLTFVTVSSYTLLGGFLAVSRTDVFQALLMVVSLLLIAAFLIGSTDSPFADATDSAQGFFNPFTTREGSPISAVFVLSAAGWAFGAFGAQRILQRFMAVEHEEQIPRSRNLSFVWIVIVYGLALTVGLVAQSALAEGAALHQLTDAERVYLVVSEVFFHPAVTGFLLTAVIAAVMSTADSQLLLASAVAADDLPLLKRVSYALSENRRVWLGRLLLVVIGAVGVFVALSLPESVGDLVAYAWGGMGAAFGPVTLLALFWRRFNLQGAVACILAGTLVATIWAFSDGGPSGMWDMQPATPGFIVASVVAVIVTLATPPPSRDIVDLFDRVNAR